MEDNLKPTGRGGAGRGQGRKHAKAPKLDVTLSIDPDLVTWMDSFGVRRRSFVANMAIRYYKEQDDKLRKQKCIRALHLYAIADDQETARQEAVRKWNTRQ